MTVLLSAQGLLVLEGSCPVEDAEALLQHLASTPTATVDLRGCESAHSAVIQVLMAAKPKLLGPPPYNPMWSWVYPALETHISE
jgi:hypothetical protein